jgi:hypothetical protein
MSDWSAIVVEGAERELRAFVSGFVADRGLDPSSVVFGDDVGLAHDGLADRLRALLGGGRHVVLVPQDLSTPLVDALRRAGPEVGLDVLDCDPIHETSFRFSAEVFARDVATVIRQALAARVPDVRFAEHTEEEEAHDENKGVELYAPVHDYTYRVRGKVVGPLGGVLQLRRALGEIEAVTVDCLEVE